MAQAVGKPAEDLDWTLWDCFEATTNQFPNREAIVSLWQSPQLSTLTNRDYGVGGRPQSSLCLRWTYRELRARVNAFAANLGNSGFDPGMQFLAILGNSAEYGLCLWTAARVGASFIPIDPRSQGQLREMGQSIRPTVVVLQNAAAASSFEKLQLDLPSNVILLQCEGTTKPPWISLQDFVIDTPAKEREFGQPETLKEAELLRTRRQIPLILATSGTTGQPKLCAHSHMNLMSQTCDYDPHPDGTVDRWLVHTPVSHIFAVNNVLRGWKTGATVVFPSMTFDIDATIQALVQEQCTVMSATPTLAKALVGHPEFPGPEHINLLLVTLAGTNISLADIKLCREALGSQNAIQAYGLTEGAPLLSWSRSDPLLEDGYHPGVGRALPGAAVKICHPKTRETLRVGDIGELHISGTSVISHYYGDSDSSQFYDDHGTRWFATGDQARLDNDGVVYILGRYKELIIRGGENIYPLKIEGVLAELPDLEACVVGIPDEFAGQVPVAVVRLPDGTTKEDVAKKALTLGPNFSLAHILTFDEVGIENIPLTTLGKMRRSAVQVEVLKAIEAKKRSPAADGPYDAHQRLIDTLVDFWEQLTSVRLMKDQRVTYAADSITMLRFCDKVVRNLGIQLYIRDLADQDTVEKQAQLLEARDTRGVNFGIQIPLQAMSASDGTSEACWTPTTHGALTPTGSSVAPLDLHARPMSRIQAAEQALSVHGFDVSVIEEMIPIRESLRRIVDGPRPQSYFISLVFRLGEVSLPHIRHSIQHLVSSHSPLRALFCEASDGDIFHCILKSQKEVFQHLMSNIAVDTAAEATAYSRDHPLEISPQSFMFHAVIRFCKEDSSHYLSLNFNHSIVDAMTAMPWIRDLDALLSHETTKLPPTTPYKHFTDLLDEYSDSRPAQTAVAFHVKRLRGISLMRRALWPLQKAPGWMIADDSLSEQATVRKRTREVVWEGEWAGMAEAFRSPRIARIVNVPGLALLSQRYSVTPQNFTKAAIVLLNVLQTGASHAIFNTWEDGRSWPFVPPWIESLLPPPLSIDGPTVEWLLTMTEVDWTESVATFLERIEAEHVELQEHVHAPWSHILRDLKDEGEIAVEASFRQSFVWDVSLGCTLPNGYKRDLKVLEPVARYDWPDCGLFWNAFMLDAQSVCFMASWDTAQMNDVEVQGHCDALASIMRALSKEDSWKQTLGQVFNDERHSKTL